MPQRRKEDKVGREREEVKVEEMTMMRLSCIGKLFKSHLT
jgi:hypothetical protein